MTLLFGYWMPMFGHNHDDRYARTAEWLQVIIARDADAYVMHGDPPERLTPKIDDMR